MWLALLTLNFSSKVSAANFFLCEKVSSANQKAARWGGRTARQGCFAVPYVS